MSGVVGTIGSIGAAQIPVLSLLQEPASHWSSINLESVALWGALATLALAGIMIAAKEWGLSRMSIPFMLGTAWTPVRWKAKTLGSALHMFNGWVFAVFYAWGFESLGAATWWIGLLGGLFHAGVVLTVGMTLLPYVHPRMATERQGPTPTRWLQPPGFLALNYGKRTVYAALVAHAAYGTILGAFYDLGG